MASNESSEMHEQLVDHFGSHVFQVRSETMQRLNELVNDAESRTRLGTIAARAYDEASTLPPEQLEVAMKLAEIAVDVFARKFLVLLSHRGVDLKIDERYALRYELFAELIDLCTEHVVARSVINHSGRKFFPEYWGRWLNKLSCRGQ